jgi:hypothetical protein
MAAMRRLCRICCGVALRRAREKITRNPYQSRIVKIFAEDRPTGLEDGQIKIPLPKSDWEWLLSVLASPFDNGTVLAKSTVSGYINALKFLHTEKQLLIESDIKVLLKHFDESFKRIVASELLQYIVQYLKIFYNVFYVCMLLDLKERGVMKIHEGKLHFTMDTFAQLCRHALFAAEDRSRFSRYENIYLFMIIR